MQTLQKPRWIKAKVPSGANYKHLKTLMRSLNLHTVCEEARCPNIGECWGAGTLTFMILGDICTRSCGFCNVKTGRGGELDWHEPERVAEAVSKLVENNAYINHIVITSVNRDDKNYESALLFAETIRKVREYNPDVNIEVLIPDFKGDMNALKEVLDARPDVLNHNIETVPRLYYLPQQSPSGRRRAVRPQARYEWSLRVLEESKRIGHEGLLTKSGIMVGLGEELEEVLGTLRDLKDVGCDIVTIGQYLQPSPDHLPITRYYHPLEFESLKIYGETMIGIPHIEAGPLVRSSYHAQKQVIKLGGGVS
ncbi:MAG TPA: lipoyl synthase [Thermodesulfobacteriota bacterium]|nr:lipoyl synthase [Thermodesulfobacteriota bacterium]